MNKFKNILNLVVLVPMILLFTGLYFRTDILIYLISALSLFTYFLLTYSIERFIKLNSKGIGTERMLNLIQMEELSQKIKNKDAELLEAKQKLSELELKFKKFNNELNKHKKVDGSVASIEDSIEDPKVNIKIIKNNKK